MKPKRRNIRFSAKSIGVSLLDDSGVELYEGETEGINSNGCGAYIRPYFASVDTDKNELENKMFRLRFHAPDTVLTSTTGLVIRVKDSDQPDYPIFIAMKFLPPINIKNLWKTVI